MHWELWDVGSKNLVEEFDSEDEALRGVREILAVNSPDLLDSLVLGAMYSEGEPRDIDLPPVLRGEDLRARLAGSAQEAVTEAAREVHARIRKWLAEEGWHVRDVGDSQSSFNVMATLPSGPDVNIFQLKNHIDHITVSQHWLYTDEVRSVIGLLPDRALEEVVWNIYRDVSGMGLEFYGLDTPFTEMTLRTYIYFDGLTKDTLVQRIFLTIRALALAQQTFVRALEMHRRTTQAEGSADLAASADLTASAEVVASDDIASSSDRPLPSREELKQIFRIVPPSDSPSALAG